MVHDLVFLLVSQLTMKDHIVRPYHLAGDDDQLCVSLASGSYINSDSAGRR